MSGDRISDDHPTIRMTNKGVEVPEDLIGRTGTVVVVHADLVVRLQYASDGIQEYDRNLIAFPPTDNDVEHPMVPNGHLRIDGKLYRVIDDRDLDECPECGSDQVAAWDIPPKCYGCDTVLGDKYSLVTDGGISRFDGRQQ
ncbi:hypothetical protein [Natronocalculus amylovorans]|uniref:Uncharacterized protein n=1 Tax=Natronocalculus amylovorans TaxID=2917812 RepID=A0AAE3K9H5_9EURY|nr:hypothetical protein [Natronocalculus amylovorans]MCL9818352.1 hypothetical protein [Natronocalculus amylovorans]